MRPPPRLHVLTATRSNRAVVLRRGPSDQVAVLLWNRRSNQIQLGQWLKARVHEFRCDISPDGRHLVYFACRNGRCWTAVSRVPWIKALAFWPQSDSWHGGGAFTDDGQLWLNGSAPPKDLPDGLSPAATDAFPHATDGFYMGNLVWRRLEQRGWNHLRGSGYDAELQLDLVANWKLNQSFVLGAGSRSLISSRFALESTADQSQRALYGWEWADRHGSSVQWAEAGALWQAHISGNGTLEDRRLLYDFTSMEFEALSAPYEGVNTGADR